MIIFFQELIMLLIIWILRMIDGMIEIFKTLFIFKNNNLQNQSINVLKYLIEDSKIIFLFWTILIITIFLVSLFTIITIIKNMISGKKNTLTIISKLFICMISTLIILIIVVVIISICDSLLIILLNYFNKDLEYDISSLIFDSAVNNWFNNYSILEISFSNITPRKVLGDYVYKSYLIWPMEWKLNGMVDPNTFLYLPSLITSIVVLFSLLYTGVSLIKRIYEIVLLYIIMPLSISTIPFDDGERFKLWLEQLIKKLAQIFIILFSLNILYIVLPIMMECNVNINISNYGKSIIDFLIICSGFIFFCCSPNWINKIFFKENINSNFLRSNI